MNKVKREVKKRHRILPSSFFPDIITSIFLVERPPLHPHLIQRLKPKPSSLLQTDINNP